MNEITAWTFIIAITAAQSTARADDLDLDEAQGLPDASESSPDQEGILNSGHEEDLPSPSSPSVSALCNHRGYARIEYSVIKAATIDANPQSSFPNMTGQLAGDCRISPKVQFFGDVRGLYRDVTEKYSAILDQGGLRFRPRDQLVAAIGKERNRRSPGLVVSPSDFIHRSENLPGQDEQRTGEWLTRLSWQTREQTADIILLPVAQSKTNGLPENGSTGRGWAARYFRQLSNIDLSFAAGYVDDSEKAGVSAQGFIFSGWRLYSEAGFDREKEHLTFRRHSVRSYLLGTGFDGDKFTVRGEYYRNGAGLDNREFTTLRNNYRRALAMGSSSPIGDLSGKLLTPFMRRDYAIFNAGLIEIYDRFNLTASMIRSLEDSSWVVLSRFDWLVSARSVLGLTLKNYDDADNSQYFARPLDWEASADWKWSF